MLKFLGCLHWILCEVGQVDGKVYRFKGRVEWIERGRRGGSS